MPVLNDIIKNGRKYRACVTADIVNHFAQISHWVPEAEHDEFQERMHNSILQNNAWCTDNTFLYYTKDNRRLAKGVALFGQEHALELLSLFTWIFSLEDKETHLMNFQLHPGKFMSEYKTILTITSMKRHHRNSKHPLQVNVQKFREKVFRLLEKGK